MIPICVNIYNIILCNYCDVDDPVGGWKNIYGKLNYKYKDYDDYIRVCFNFWIDVRRDIERVVEGFGWGDGLRKLVEKRVPGREGSGYYSG